MPSGLTAIDWIIVALYALGTLALGWHYGRSHKTTRDYFVGSGSINSLLIGVSLFATLLSTISYLSMPGEAIGKGPVWLASLLGHPLIYLFVGYVLLPVYMRQRVTSAYELLEQRLGRGTRLLGAGMFILLRLVWMSTLIYFAASALAVIIGVDPRWEPVIVAVAGLVAVGYTSLGGLRAVVVTDFVQTVLLYGGAVLVVAIVTFKMGGCGWFPTQWHANWDQQPVLSLDPSVRLSVIGTLLSVTLWHACTLGGDQTSVQRFMATRDLKAARRSLAAKLIVGIFVLTTLFLAGFALLGYYEAFPDALEGLSLKDNADKIFPHFIATGLPPVVRGLVVAALLAAAMSSVDSGINSIAAVVMTDFLPDSSGGNNSAASDAGEGTSRAEAAEQADSQTAHLPASAVGEAASPPDRPPDQQPQDDAGRFRQARLLALAIGAVVVAASSLVKYVPGNITAITGKTVNLLTVPIFCLFFFALFVKRAKPVGAWLGCAAGVIVAVSIAFSGPIFGYRADTGTDPVSFIWMAPATLVTNITVGLLACWLLPGPDRLAGRIWQPVPALLAVLFAIGLTTIWRPSIRIRLSPSDRQRCEQVLREGLRGEEFWPAMHAAEGLTIGGRADEVRRYLQQKLETAPLNDQQRCGVARELVRAGDTSKLQVLWDILAGADNFGHVHAAESLYKVADIGDNEALRRAFHPDQPAPLRRMAAAALGKFGDGCAMIYLRDSLVSADAGACRTAAWVLGRIGSARDVEPIRSRLARCSSPVDRAVLEHALAALGDTAGQNALLGNLISDNPQIRASAAAFAGDARMVKAAPQLRRMLADPQADVRIRAAQSLLDLANR